MLNKTIHCLVLHKLLDWIDPSFRNLPITTLVENVNRDSKVKNGQLTETPHSPSLSSMANESQVAGATTSVMRSDYANTLRANLAALPTDHQISDEDDNQSDRIESNQCQE